jgi:hypothetical protein
MAVLVSVASFEDPFCPDKLRGTMWGLALSLRRAAKNSPLGERLLIEAALRDLAIAFTVDSNSTDPRLRDRREQLMSRLMIMVDQLDFEISGHPQAMRRTRLIYLRATAETLLYNAEMLFA